MKNNDYFRSRSTEIQTQALYQEKTGNWNDGNIEKKYEFRKKRQKRVGRSTNMKEELRQYSKNPRPGSQRNKTSKTEFVVKETIDPFLMYNRFLIIFVYYIIHDARTYHDRAIVIVKPWARIMYSKMNKHSFKISYANQTDIINHNNYKILTKWVFIA